MGVTTVRTGESGLSNPATYAGPEIDLRAISQDQVSFELKDQKSAGEMRPAGEVGSYRYRYVVMPMRI